MVRATAHADVLFEGSGSAGATPCGEPSQPTARPSARRSEPDAEPRAQQQHGVRHDALLTTKLYPPATPSDAVTRPRLVEQLADAFGQRLTLLSAPAGYGKTTLLSAWAATSGLPVAWLSLDESDNDPTRFWSYVIAALLSVRPEHGVPALAGLENLPPAPSEPAITTIINAFAGAPQPVALVLDDYHVIHSAAIQRTVAYLIEHLPAQLRLVIASRVDPPLALARWRARGQLRELRATRLALHRSRSRCLSQRRDGAQPGA